MAHAQRHGRARGGRRCPAASASGARPDQLEFRELYRELIETNTSHSVGSCTLAAEKMAARLRAAGFADAELHSFAVTEHPKDGGLVAVLPGTDRAAKAILLLAHLDVVEARREDWSRDPFTLIEEGGYFYGRGTFDDKSMAAVWVDTLIRLRKQGYKPTRSIKMALTCGEEAGSAFEGAEYLVKHERALIDAAFALNEFAYGVLDAQGRRVVMEIEAGEKTDQDFRLEVLNPGGHSSRPVKDNAIYHLAAGLTRLGDYEFPLQLNDTTRAYFSRMSGIVGGDDGRGDAITGQRPGRSEGGRHAVAGSTTECHAAHHLRGDVDGRGSRHQCAAAAGARQRQLPHFPRGRHRGCAADADASAGGCGDHGNHRSALRPGGAAAAVDGGHYEAD